MNNCLYGVLNIWNPYWTKHFINDIDLLSFIGFILDTSWPIDRFDIINKDCNFKLKTNSPIPKGGLNYNLNIENICDVEALNLEKISKYTNKQIYLMWSGGVDSTAVAVAFIKNNINFKILCTEASFIENHNFKYNLIKNNIDIILYKINNLQETINNLISPMIVTGHCGDPLFGSSFNQANSGLYYNDYLDGFNNIFKIYENLNMINSKNRNRLIDALYYFIKKTGINIETFGELIWLLDFVCKYSYQKEEFGMVVSNYNLRKDIYNFYDTTDFQLWSLHNYKENCKYLQTDPKHYKKELKLYIYNYNKDKEYFLYKGKVASKYLDWKNISNITVLTEYGYEKLPKKFEATKLYNIFISKYLKRRIYE